jgi:hypothetical protein
MNKQAFKINKEDLIQYFVRHEDGEIIYHRTESGFRNYRTIISVVVKSLPLKAEDYNIKLNMFCAEKNLKKDLMVTIIKQNDEQIYQSK